MDKRPASMSQRIGGGKKNLLKGWRYGVFLGGVVLSIGLAIYPIIIDPMLNPEKYKKMQAINRKGIDQASIQPGNMKVWSDPFKPLPKDH